MTKVIGSAAKLVTFLFSVKDESKQWSSKSTRKKDR